MVADSIVGTFQERGLVPIAAKVVEVNGTGSRTEDGITESDRSCTCALRMNIEIRIKFHNKE